MVNYWNSGLSEFGMRPATCQGESQAEKYPAQGACLHPSEGRQVARIENDAIRFSTLLVESKRAARSPEPFAPIELKINWELSVIRH
jgi:hypothetical protein